MVSTDIRVTTVDATLEPSYMAFADRGRSRTPRSPYSRKLPYASSFGEETFGGASQAGGDQPVKAIITCPRVVSTCIRNMQAVPQLPCKADDCNKYWHACEQQVNGCSSGATALAKNCKTAYPEGACTPTKMAVVSAAANPCIRPFSAFRGQKKSRGKGGKSGHSTATPTTSSSSSDTSISGSENEDDAQRNAIHDLLEESIDLSDIEDNSLDPRRRSSHEKSSSDDLTILVGDRKFYHSSTILGYASDYIRGNMMERGSHGGYFLDLSFHSPEEWEVVLEFLKPRSVGQAELSFVTLPTVLPWFAEFQLHVLLNDVDQFLVQSVREAEEMSGRPCPLALSNVLLLVNVSVACGLEATQVQAKHWLKEKLLHPQLLLQSFENDNDSSVFDDVEEVDLEWTLSDLQFLSRILGEFDELRDNLWESTIINYLPHDLSVEDSLTLVSNPLFPYLLREGMMQLCMVQKAQTLIDQQKKKSNKVSRVSPISTTSSATTIVMGPTSKKEHGMGALTQDLLNVLLRNTYDNLVKFQQEADYGAAASEWKRKEMSKNRITAESNKERRRRQNQKSEGQFPFGYEQQGGWREAQAKKRSTNREKNLPMLRWGTG